MEGYPFCVVVGEWTGVKENRLSAKTFEGADGDADL